MDCQKSTELSQGAKLAKYNRQQWARITKLEIRISFCKNLLSLHISVSLVDVYHYHCLSLLLKKILSELKSVSWFYVYFALQNETYNELPLLPAPPSMKSEVFGSEWVIVIKYQNGVCFSAIQWREQVTFDDNDIMFVLDHDA
jgi:hypothetical protein